MYNWVLILVWYLETGKKFGRYQQPFAINSWSTPKLWERWGDKNWLAGLSQTDLLSVRAHAHPFVADKKWKKNKEFTFFLVLYLLGLQSLKSSTGKKRGKRNEAKNRKEFFSGDFFMSNMAKVKCPYDLRCFYVLLKKRGNGEGDFHRKSKMPTNLNFCIHHFNGTNLGQTQTGKINQMIRMCKWIRYIVKELFGTVKFGSILFH